MLKEIRFKTRDNMTVIIPLGWKYTLITGNGDTGKTYIFKELSLYASNNNKSMVFLNQLTLQYVKMLPSLSEDILIVVDNFDLIRLSHPEITDILNNMLNQVLLIGRDCLGLRVGWDNEFYLVRKGNILTTEAIMKCSKKG